MKIVRVYLGGLLIVSALNAFGQGKNQKHCSTKEAMQAEDSIDELKSWDAVYASYKRFSHCDDASIGEGYSDVVGKLLGDKWAEFPKLAKLAQTDLRFQRFVLKHIDETVPADTLEMIARNAKLRCSSGAKRLCALVAEAVAKLE